MPIIPLDCPACGGNLSVNSDDSAAICNYCGKPFVVKDAIVNNYIKNVVNINANTVNIISREDFEIVAGVLKSYNGSSIDITIPEGVIEIGKEAFAHKSYLRSVIFPNSLRVISEFAFFNCISLKNVSLPNGLEIIGSHAFCSCNSLAEVIIPNNTKVYFSAFRDNPKLKLNLPPSINQLERLGIYISKNNMDIGIIQYGIGGYSSYTHNNCSSELLCQSENDKCAALVFADVEENCYKFILQSDFDKYSGYNNGQFDHYSTYYLFTENIKAYAPKIQLMLDSADIKNFSMQYREAPIIKSSDRKPYKTYQAGSRLFLFIQIPMFP